MEQTFQQIQTDVSALDIKITAQEIALYLSEKKVPPEHLEAMKEFIAYLSLVVKLNSSHSAKKGLICDFEYIW